MARRQTARQGLPDHPRRVRGIHAGVLALASGGIREKGCRRPARPILVRGLGRLCGRTIHADPVLHLRRVSWERGAGGGNAALLRFAASSRFRTAIEPYPESARQNRRVAQIDFSGEKAPVLSDFSQPIDREKFAFSAAFCQSFSSGVFSAAPGGAIPPFDVRQRAKERNQHIARADRDDGFNLFHATRPLLYLNSAFQSVAE